MGQTNEAMDKYEIESQTNKKKSTLKRTAIKFWVDRIDDESPVRVYSIPNIEPPPVGQCLTDRSPTRPPGPEELRKPGMKNNTREVAQERILNGTE